MRCRHCGTDLKLLLLDLGSAPPSNAYLTEEALHKEEKKLPLRVLVCEKCWLAQTEDFAQANELFDSGYAYFSGFSSSWLEHAENYVTDMVSRFNLNTKSHVIEVAANDGYLLQFVKQRGIPCTGVEPTSSTADAARLKNIPIIEDFFGVRLASKLAESGVKADLIIANNVLAHVPDINDFVSGFTKILKTDGVATFEFPHLLALIKGNQFDTVYHEHFSYLSFTAVNNILTKNGLRIFDVQELSTHGGSLRVYAQLIDKGLHVCNESVENLLYLEKQAGMQNRVFYSGFQEKAEKIRKEFLVFLREAKKQGKSVVAYGAAAKGNTLFNFAGINSELISYVTDRNPIKKGKYMPGSRIPIVDESNISRTKPDYIVILPWNLKKEIINQLSEVRGWGGAFVTTIPDLQLIK